MGQLSEEDKAFLEEFNNMEMLSMNNTNLKSTQNFPVSNQLLRIELSSNHLTGKDLPALASYAELRTLKLKDNEIKNLEDLKCLEVLKELASLNLSGNPVTEVEDYREKIYEMFPKLDILDGFDKGGNEINTEENEDDEEEEYQVEENPGEEYGEEEYGDEEGEESDGKAGKQDEEEEENNDEGKLGKRQRDEDDADGKDENEAED